MEGGLLGCLPCQNGVGPILDKEGGGKGITSHDGQVQQAVALGVLDVKVTLVADQCVGNAIMTVEQSQVQWYMSLCVTLVQFVRELGGCVRVIRHSVRSQLHHGLKDRWTDRQTD